MVRDEGPAALRTLSAISRGTDLRSFNNGLCLRGKMLSSRGNCLVSLELSVCRTITRCIHTPKTGDGFSIRSLTVYFLRDHCQNKPVAENRVPISFFLKSPERCECCHI